jgi:Helicase conserved C-terminal domain
VEDIGRRFVFDVESEDHTEGVDTPPGSDVGEALDAGGHMHRRLLEMAREAERLEGEQDAKLLKAVDLVRELLADGYRPILFCRFIPTADYVARELRQRLPKDVEVAAVTGTLPPADREARVAELTQASKRVLVCTDCLSEGINLQDYFDAVLHYDLAWNPTRHEQREGRVDRYGQPRSTVRVLTYYGSDNPIDGMVIDVLIRKHQTIRSSLGISVPVPVNTDTVARAIFESVIFRGQAPSAQQLLPGLEQHVLPQQIELHAQWEDIAEREKRSRTMFAQESLAGMVYDVARELEEARAAVGSAADVATFTVEGLRAHQAVVTGVRERLRFDLADSPLALRDALEHRDTFEARFELPVDDRVLYLSRTHPIVEGLAAHVLDTALDPMTEGVARRAGAIRTSAVTRRTTLLLVRFRYDIVTRRGPEEQSQLAEECRVLAFAGASTSPEWLDNAAAEALLNAEPDTNIHPEQASTFVRRVVEGFETLQPRLDAEAHCRAEALLDAHRRVRTAARMQGVSYRVEPQLPPDVLGIFVYLPTVSGGLST